VIHFAGHYIPNSKTPSRSKFLFTDGDLPVEEVLKIKLPRTRLMVLSACETGVENFYNGEGMIGAARAFLASDVPMVVASTWSVDSEATAELMNKFHRYRKSDGLTVTAALRQAQIDLLSDEGKPFRHPFFWAGFLPIGGFVEY
jgi:CHAT domain-containing protein